MSNTSLIKRSLQILDEYETGHQSPEQAEGAIEFQMQAMEGIGLAEIQHSRSLTYRLVAAHFSDGLEEFIDTERVATVVSELRQFLSGLPADPGA